MTRYLFSLLLLLLLVSCTLCNADAESATVELFLKEDNISDALEADGKKKAEEFHIDKVSSPFLVGADNVLVALVRAQLRDSNHLDIFTRFIETKEGWGDDAVKADKWKKQVALKTEKEDDLAFAAVAKGKEIYLFSASKGTKEEEWVFNLTKRTVDGDEEEKQVEWKEEEVKEDSWKEIREQLKKVKPVDGSAFLVEDERPVFVLRARNEDDSKYSFVVVESNKNPDEWTFKLTEAGENCDATFFSWESKLYMALKGGTCEDKNLKVWDATTKKWEEAKGEHAENLKKVTGEKEFVISISIDESNDVLLLAEKTKNGEDQKKFDVVLHMANNKHSDKLKDPIVTKVDEISDGSLFYAYGELVFLSQQGDKSVLHRLKDVPGEIKKVLQKWEEEDKQAADQIQDEDEDAGVRSEEDENPDKGGETTDNKEQPADQKEQPDDQKEQPDDQKEQPDDQKEQPADQKEQADDKKKQPADKGEGNNGATTEGPDYSVLERVNMGVVLLCALFGVLAPHAL